MKKNTKANKTQKNLKKSLAVPQTRMAVPSAAYNPVQVSENTLYAIFFTVSFAIAGLLFGASTDIIRMQIAFPTESLQRQLIESRVNSLAEGYPIEEMAPYIATHNKTTAAFLVGIAKKESNWGKRVPRTPEGDDCYNYWGYRGQGSRGIEMGHGCFGSPQEAVTVVGKRINTLVTEYNFRTPEELIVWKCGWSCDGHSSQSVKKWISDVGIYYKKMKN